MSSAASPRSWCSTGRLSVAHNFQTPGLVLRQLAADIVHERLNRVESLSTLGDALVEAVEHAMSQQVDTSHDQPIAAGILRVELVSFKAAAVLAQRLIVQDNIAEQWATTTRILFQKVVTLLVEVASELAELYPSLFSVTRYRPDKIWNICLYRSLTVYAYQLRWQNISERMAYFCSEVQKL